MRRSVRRVCERRGRYCPAACAISLTVLPPPASGRDMHFPANRSALPRRARPTARVSWGASAAWSGLLRRRAAHQRRWLGCVRRETFGDRSARYLRGGGFLLSAVCSCAAAACTGSLACSGAMVICSNPDYIACMFIRFLYGVGQRLQTVRQAAQVLPPRSVSA